MCLLYLGTTSTPALSWNLEVLASGVWCGDPSAAWLARRPPTDSEPAEGGVQFGLRFVI